MSNIKTIELVNPEGVLKGKWYEVVEITEGCGRTVCLITSSGESYLIGIGAGWVVNILPTEEIEDE